MSLSKMSKPYLTKQAACDTLAQMTRHCHAMHTQSGQALANTRDVLRCRKASRMLDPAKGLVSLQETIRFNRSAYLFSAPDR